MNYLNRLLFVTMAVILLAGCSKEYSLETGGLGGNPSNPLTDYGWVFTGKPNENYHGCIDTAYYATNQGLKGLFIEGTDSAGNSFMIIYVPQNGVFAPGTYGVNQGAAITVTDQNGTSYIPKPPAPLTLQITKVNDTLVEGNFSATLSNPLDNSTFNVSNGQVKALIGKPNPCDGTIPGGGTGDAEFTLASTGGNCANPYIEGDYFRGVAFDEFNIIELEVDVAVPGDWSVNTVTVNGVSFSGSGTFNSAGTDYIILTGSGTPTATGTTNIPIQAGGTTCTVTLQVSPTTVAVQGTGDYFPTTTNSRWVYNILQLSAGISDSTEVVNSGKTAVVQSQTYNMFDGDLFGVVYRKGGGNYYRYGSVDLFDVIDSSFKAEMIFLKDNVALGSTWESPVQSTTIGSNSIKFKRVFTITAKSVSLTVRGVVYNDVITVKEELMVQVQTAPFQTVEETLISYAKGVGMIQALNRGYSLKVDLKRAQIF